MKIYFSLLFFLLAVHFNYAQNQLKGKVTDQFTGAPLNAATVYSLESNKGVFTRDDGTFSITGFGKGTFHVKISYLGYQPEIREVIFSDTDDTIDLNITMTYQPQTIEEVVITNAYFKDQKNNTFPVEVIKSDDLRQNGAFTVMDEIEKVPGVDAVTTGPMVSRPVIRGLSGNRVLTLLNGARFETQQWDDEHGIGINELGVDQIEIIKGPSALLYGPEAIGGVINFIEEPPAAVGTKSGSALAALHSNNLGALAQAEFKAANENFNWGISALGKLFSDYFYNGYEFRVPNTRLLEYAAKAHAGVTKKWGSSKLSYTFNNAYYGILDGKDIVKDENGQIKNIDTLEKEKFPLEIEAPFHQVTDHRIASNTTILLGNSKLTGLFTYQNNHRSENEELSGSKKGYTYLDMVLQSYTYDLKWYLPEWNNFHTIIGFQGMHQNNRNIKGAATQLIPDAIINDLGFLVLSRYELDDLNITAGVRYDQRRLNSETFKTPSGTIPETGRNYQNISGSLGASYEVLHNLLIRASIASGYRSPNLNELFTNGVKLESQRFEIGDPDFKKEKNSEIDLSLHYDQSDFSIDLAAFRNDIQNYIYLNPTGEFVQGNADPEATYPEYEFRQKAALIVGGEASLDIHPANISWGHFEIKASTLTGKLKKSDSYLPMMSPTRLFNTLYLDLKDFKDLHDIHFDLGTETAFEQDEVAISEMPTPAYTIVDAALGAHIKNIDWKLSAHNLLDKEYLDHMSRFRSYEIIEPGLNISLSAKIPFLIN